MKKNFEELVEEINRQKSELEQRGITPEIILCGGLTYFTLKSGSAKENLEFVKDEGYKLIEFEGLKVVPDPNRTGGGIFLIENEIVRVLGA